jgi:hypothetical protein
MCDVIGIGPWRSNRSLTAQAMSEGLIGASSASFPRAKPQNMSPAVPHDQKSIEQAKPDCRHDENIHRCDPVSVIAEECPPALGRRVSSPDCCDGRTCSGRRNFPRIEERDIAAQRSP